MAVPKSSLLRLKYISEIDFDAALLTAAPANGETACVLTTTTTEGPFFFPSPLRAYVREDREGVDLDFKLQLVNHADCSPIPGVNVVICHCDTEGRYSGYPVCPRPFPCILRPRLIMMWRARGMQWGRQTLRIFIL